MRKYCCVECLEKIRKIKIIIILIIKIKIKVIRLKIALYSTKRMCRWCRPGYPVNFHPSLRASHSLTKQRNSKCRQRHGWLFLIVTHILSNPYPISILNTCLKYFSQPYFSIGRFLLSNFQFFVVLENFHTKYEPRFS